MRHLLINTVLLNQDQAHYCSIRYNGFRDLTYQSWQGNISDADLEKGYHSALDVLAKTACANVIHDCRGIAQMDAENLSKIAERWLRQALAGGVKYVAHIAAADLPVDPFSALLTQNQPAGPYELGVFDNVDEAMSWIAYKNMVVE